VTPAPRRWARTAVAVLVAAGAALPSAPAAAAQPAPAPIQGRGSSYVAPAMTQWKAAVFPQGLRVSYLPTNSPDGLGQYQQGSIDFAGTEAEFPSLLGAGTDAQVTRGFQYVPDVGGAVAIMYNVTDRAGNKVNYLRLRRQTVARIFIGEIKRWSDPAITQDLGGKIVLPDEEITVVFRAGPSGTTALFYDFVQHMIPDKYRAWAQRNRYPTGVRLIDPGVSPNFVPRGLGLQGSDQMAQHVARTPWTITYDEFAYAKQYNVNVAWVENASGEFVQPYAGNISAALESARLNPDLTQNLEQVYNSRAGGAYPISSYSYLVTQCAGNASARANCRGGYPDAGKAETLARFMRYIACEGQVQMSTIGYSPLPPVLSQEMANSSARMTGRPGERLTQANCKNPRFDPNYRPEGPPPPPPLPPVAAGPGAGGTGTTGGAGDGGTEGGGGAGENAGADDATTSTVAGEEAAAPGREGGPQAVGGGSGTWRDDEPVSYRGRGSDAPARWAVAVLVLLLVIPLVAGGIHRRFRLARRS
jgi:phosphate transport system substrate-binding protein